MTTYECSICHNINHVSKLHCSTCGVAPPQYSMIGIASYKVEACESSYAYFMARDIPCVVAKGCDRAEHHHTSKSYLRTVPLDYYGE